MFICSMRTLSAEVTHPLRRLSTQSHRSTSCGAGATRARACRPGSPAAKSWPWAACACCRRCESRRRSRPPPDDETTRRHLQQGDEDARARERESAHACRNTPFAPAACTGLTHACDGEMWSSSPTRRTAPLKPLAAAMCFADEQTGRGRNKIARTKVPAFGARRGACFCYRSCCTPPPPLHARAQSDHPAPGPLSPAQDVVATACGAGSSSRQAGSSSSSSGAHARDQ